MPATRFGSPPGPYGWVGTLAEQAAVTATIDADDSRAQYLFTDIVGRIDEFIGGAWVQTHEGGRALVTDQSQALTQGLLTATGAPKTTPTTALPRFANNVNAPNGAASAAAAEIATILAADVVTRTFTTGDVDGVVITCKGGAGFTGLYVTLSATDIGTTQAAIRLTGVSDDNARQRWEVMKGERVFIPFPGLVYVYMVAMDVDGSESNSANLVPV